MRGNILALSYYGNLFIFQMAIKQWRRNGENNAAFKQSTFVRGGMNGASVPFNILFYAECLTV